MKTFYTKVIEKIQSYDLEIVNEFKAENEDFIILQDCTISVNDKSELFVSFHINTSPSYAAKIILILNETKGIKNFFVGDDYTFDSDGKFLDGEEAIKYKDSDLKDHILRNFMEEQHQLYYLHNTKPFNC